MQTDKLLMKTVGESDDVTFLSVCAYHNAGGPPTWACGDDASRCDEGNFTISTGAIQYMNITGNLSATISPLPANSSTSGSTSSFDRNADCHTTTVGAAVGISLGIAFLASFAWALLEKRRRRRKVELMGYIPRDPHPDVDLMTPSRPDPGPMEIMERDAVELAFNQSPVR
jgi:hypothetical protein